MALLTPGRVGKRSRGRNVVDVIALHAFKEVAKAAANHGLAVPGEVIGETNARHDVL